MDSRIHNELTVPQIRQLLVKWYDAAATETEEQALIDWFCAADEADIPADMAQDASIFRAMGHLSEPLPDVAEAVEAIDSAVSLARRRRRRLFVRRFAIGTSAAAAVAFALFGIGMAGSMDVDMSVNGGQASSPRVADAVIAPLTEHTPDEDADYTYAVETPAPDQNSEMIAEASVKPVNAIRKTKKTPADYGYREIDADEAAEVMDEVFRMLNTSTSEAMAASADGAGRELRVINRKVENSVRMLNAPARNAIRTVKNTETQINSVINQLNITI
ncbi:MAG: hypothetical protein Q4F07_04930 [Bacteroidales bacterium]|nr:hypothetical protein [Bacteroidales bacterium]